MLSDENELSLNDFKGKKILLVNTASHCGFTKQYSELQQLYNDFQEQLMVIAFPCNQFANQEPGDDHEISSFCQINFQVTFPIAKKIHVNGPNAHPLFKYIVECLPGLLGSQAIKWNFTKFLFDENGAPVRRFSPSTNPKQIAKFI
jgi:glutathione peroxidase